MLVAPSQPAIEAVFEDHTFSIAISAYDEKGRRTETIRHMGKLSERVPVRYDDFDNPIEEVSSDVNREMRMDGGAVRIEEPKTIIATGIAQGFKPTAHQTGA
jgi:hypothetical protein